MCCTGNTQIVSCELPRCKQQCMNLLLGVVQEAESSDTANTFQIMQTPVSIQTKCVERHQFVKILNVLHDTILHRY